MTVLVTGGAGFVGGHVVSLLRARGAAVRVLVRRGEAPPGGIAGVESCEGDLTDRRSLEEAVRGVDRVLHCAARTGPWGPRSEYEATNVRGVELLLEAALSAGVQRFVHVSSAIVIGTDVGGAADESAPLRVEPNPYSWSKVMAERLLLRAIQERGAPVTIVRPGLVYGPGDAGHFGRIAAMVAQGRMVVIGTGKNHIPLVYVGDVAAGIVLASEAPRAVGRTYFLVNDEPVTQGGYLAAIAAELGAAPPTRRVPYRAAKYLAAVAEGVVRLSRARRPPPLTRFGVRLLGGESRLVIARAREDLGYVPRTSMADGVSRSVAWYRDAYLASPERVATTHAAGGSS